MRSTLTVVQLMHMPLNKKKKTTKKTQQKNPKEPTNKKPTTEKPRWGWGGINFLTNNHCISNAIEM